jgi:hypothetical protein
MSFFNTEEDLERAIWAIAKEATAGRAAVA